MKTLVGNAATDDKYVKIVDLIMLRVRSALSGLSDSTTSTIFEKIEAAVKDITSAVESTSNADDDWSSCIKQLADSVQQVIEDTKTSANSKELASDDEKDKKSDSSKDVEISKQLSTDSKASDSI